MWSNLRSMTVDVSDGGRIREDRVASPGEEILKALGRPSREAHDLPQTALQPCVLLERFERLRRRTHGHAFALQHELVEEHGAVSRGDHNVVFHIGTVAEIQALLHLLGIQRDPAPGAVPGSKPGSGCRGQR